MQNSTTKAGLRGIHAVGGGVAWASGTNGTVLRTEDGGYMWQSCAMPPGAEKLDFRGIWAWDADRAVVMSSGPGELSRIYKTTDGCSSWKLLYTNPDKGGFWDAVAFSDRTHGFLFGDPVGGRFYLAWTEDGGTSWHAIVSDGLRAATGSGAFAASNSALALTGPIFGAVNAPWFGTSGPGGSYVYRGGIDCTMGVAQRSPDECLKHWTFDKDKLPLAGDNSTSGAFSLDAIASEKGTSWAVAVGGDYKKPDESSGTAAFWHTGDRNWTAATKPPHGYRSSVAWDATDRAWIAAGTNGSDISYDDGKTWTSLDDGKWNALSLPWVVGPEGRIGKLVSLKVAGLGKQ
jgi:photosystem II stability/assembly factor-like uncharacterized protein